MSGVLTDPTARLAVQPLSRLLSRLRPGFWFEPFGCGWGADRVAQPQRHVFGGQHLMHHAEQVGAEHIHVDLFAELDGNCATRFASYLARSNRRPPTACTRRHSGLNSAAASTAAATPTPPRNGEILVSRATQLTARTAGEDILAGHGVRGDKAMIATLRGG
jgi:hypothetical protein